MAVNKSIYVKEEDAQVWDKAKEYAGESMSQFLTNHLKSFVSSKEAEMAGFKEKIILRYTENRLATAKSFYGKWLISPDKPTVSRKPNSQSEMDYFYAVAVTAKNSVVVFEFVTKPDETGKYAWGDLHIYGSFEKAAADKNLPYGLIAAAMEKMGIEIVELDI